MRKWRSWKRNGEALDRYDEASLIVWLPVSFLYLAVTFVQLFGSASYGPWLGRVDWIMSGVFLVDYVLRLHMAEDRLKFIRHYWNIADVIVIATPLFMMRFGADFAGLARILRIIRLGLIAWKIWDGRTRTSRRGQVKWMAVVSGGVVFLAGLTVWAVESVHPDSSIHTPGDALWWAIVTMFTVGYGEMVPRTAVGKISAIVLMIAGIALFGWVTATLASLFVETGKEKEALGQRKAMQRQLDGMAQQLEEMKQHLTVLVDVLTERGEGASTSLGRAAAGTFAVGGSDVPAVSSDSVGDDPDEGESLLTLLWHRLSRPAKPVWRGWVRASHADVFWYCISVTVYWAALRQAYFALDKFWSATLLAVALFLFVRMLRKPRSWAGWLQWGALLTLAILFAADLSSMGVLWTLLAVGIGVTPVELFAALAWRPMEDPATSSASSETPDATAPD